MNEKDIVNALKIGDETCLKYLYAYLADVKKFILQNNGDEDDAKDLLQDAIIVFYNNVQSGKYQQGNLKGYILTICKHKWFDHLATIKRRKTRSIETITNLENAEENKHFEITQPISLSQYLQMALNKLGEPCKTLLNATILLKIKMEQVAVDYGYADAHSARQQKLRCLKRLRGFTSYDDIINLI